MKNRLTDLNNHLFAELERLSEEDLVLDKEKLENESIRAQMLCGVSMQILAAGHLMAKSYDMADGSFGKTKLPDFFGDGETDTGKPIITHKPFLLRKDA
ncbi:MAG: hypothetical protein LBK27_05615 [Treponema sp.]|jgi:hypothetical protein|nr:hypothetical protein [Treponema sp.]